MLEGDEDLAVVSRVALELVQQPRLQGVLVRVVLAKTDLIFFFITCIYLTLEIIKSVKPKMNGTFPTLQDGPRGLCGI